MLTFFGWLYKVFAVTIIFFICVLTRGTLYDDLDPNSVELAEMEKKIYWYITCDGEFYKRSLAIRSNWTNILTFAPAGDYAVTLVLDNDEEIEDQAPISNTILYSKRSKNSNSEEYESVPLEKED